MKRLFRDRETANTKIQLIHWLRRLAKEDGATATEYSIMVGFIALVITTGVGALGLALDGYYIQLGLDLKAALGIP